MSSPFLVPDGWKIDCWAPDHIVLPEGIPTDGVQVGGPLEITLETVFGAPFFRLDWRNQRGEGSFVSGLESNETQTELHGKNLTVFFGTHDPVQCDLIVTLHPTTEPKKRLTCTIRLAEMEVGHQMRDSPDVGSGTFTATANGGPDPVDTGAAPRRIPH